MGSKHTFFSVAMIMKLQGPVGYHFSTTSYHFARPYAYRKRTLAWMRFFLTFQSLLKSDRNTTLFEKHLRINLDLPTKAQGCNRGIYIYTDSNSLIHEVHKNRTKAIKLLGALPPYSEGSADIGLFVGKFLILKRCNVLTNHPRGIHLRNPHSGLGGEIIHITTTTVCLGDPRGTVSEATWGNRASPYGFVGLMILVLKLQALPKELMILRCVSELVVFFCWWFKKNWN